MNAGDYPLLSGKKHNFVCTQTRYIPWLSAQDALGRFIVVIGRISLKAHSRTKNYRSNRDYDPLMAKRDGVINRDYLFLIRWDSL